LGQVDIRESRPQVLPEIGETDVAQE
jgi:hypothetical protein